MKIFISKAVLMLALMFAFLGCSSDDSQMNCPKGFTGTNCDVKLAPTKIKITKIVVKSWPLFDGSYDWDYGGDGTGSYADVFIAVGYAPDNMLAISDYVVDASAVSGYLTYTFTEPLELPNIYYDYSLGLFDYDGGDEYEFMTEQIFNVYKDSDLYFPEHISISNTSQYLSADIYLTYKFDF